MLISCYHRFTFSVKVPLFFFYGIILPMNSIQCLLGDKYGYRPFPHKIKATEFEILLEVARETYDQPEHIDLLLEWFWKVK